ncbi:MAG: branched-chain amino acid ABC transporter permease [Chloroflexi bacterium]|nr:branched-chain amino acid ABC transporter permease [Chloroflexota bacterium]
MLAQIVFALLMRGGIYALLAAGFSLVLSVVRIAYLAQTALYMTSAFIIFSAVRYAGLPPIVSVVIAVIVTVLLGVVTYKWLLDRIREHQMTVLLVTLALAIIFQEFWRLIFGANVYGAPSFVSGYTELFGVRVSYQYWLVLGVFAVLLVGLLLILQRSRLGIAIRAVSQDRDIASLMGINVSNVVMSVIALSSFLAAAAGAVVAPLLVLDVQMWTSPLVIMLAAIVLGGMGSILGSVIGAFILALVEVLVVFLVPGGAFLKEAAALAVMMGVLLFRPEGLFGVVFEEERL